VSRKPEVTIGCLCMERQLSSPCHVTGDYSPTS
jgi:hypothetical protein